MNYQEYPKVMTHPGKKPAIPYKQPSYRIGEQGWGQPIDPGQTGRPAMFPDVTVRNLDQEQEYSAKGYVPSGKSDPEAYRRAMTNNEPKPETNFVEYPKVLYRAHQHGTKDNPYEERVVKNKVEENALGLGWYRTPAEALGWNEPKKEALNDGVSEQKKKKGMSAEAKKRQSEKMKQRWAEKKKSSEVHA